MLKTTVYIDDDTVEALRLISKQASKPQAQLIREAVRDFASRNYTPPLPAGLGMFESGHTDTSVNRKQLMKAAAGARRWR